MVASVSVYWDSIARIAAHHLNSAESAKTASSAVITVGDLTLMGIAWNNQPSLQAARLKASSSYRIPSQRVGRPDLGLPRARRSADPSKDRCHCQGRWYSRGRKLW